MPEVQHSEKLAHTSLTLPCTQTKCRNDDDDDDDDDDKGNQKPQTSTKAKQPTLVQ